MSDEMKRKAEAQPLTAKPMPEYRYQEQPVHDDRYSTDFKKALGEEKKLDLSGVALNLA